MVISNFKGKKHTELAKELNRQAHLGKQTSEETKLKISLKLKGRYPKNLSLLIAKSKAGLSDITKAKLSKALTGKKRTMACREAYGKFQKRLWANPEYRKRLSEAHKGVIFSREQIIKMCSKKSMSCLELKFQNIINKYNLPYKFVGHGDVIIERKVPDFINTNGQKIVIEVFYSGHKEKFSGGLENYKHTRTDIFGKYGYEVLYFNEKEVNEENILKILGDTNR